MATISASLFMALDGVVDPAVGNWHFPYFNDQMGEAVTRTHDTEVMLFGRVTKLVSSEAFDTGVVYLSYTPDPNPPTGSYEDATEHLPQD